MVRRPARVLRKGAPPAKRIALSRKMTSRYNSSMADKPIGFSHGLTNYGDRDFSLYLRRSFAASIHGITFDQASSGHEP